MNSNQPQPRTVRRPSQGLQNNSQIDMNNSTGFKDLKMRVSGQGFRPGSRNNRASMTQAPMMLQMIPMDQDENQFQSNFKADLMFIQNEIESLDRDKKIRTFSDKTFLNPSSQQIKKWMNNLSETYKNLDQRMQSNMDPESYLEYMGVTDVRQAFSKLLKMTSIVDLYLTKMTELQCVHYLAHQQSLSGIQRAQDESLEKIAQQGIQINRALLSVTNLHTISDMISVVKKQQSNKENEDSFFNLTKPTVDDTQLRMQKLQQEVGGLQEENKRLRDQLSQSQNQFEDLSRSQLSKSQFVLPNGDPNSYAALIDEIREQYANQIANQSKEITELKRKLSDACIKIDDLQLVLQEKTKEIENLKQTKDDLFQRFQQKYKTKEEFGDSYEAALQDEYNRMKTSFEQKIAQLRQDLEATKRSNNQTVSELKNLLEKEVDKYRLVSKKLSLYMKV